MSDRTRYMTLERKFRAERKLRELMLRVGNSKQSTHQPQWIYYTENRDEFVARGSHRITFDAIYPYESDLVFIIFQSVDKNDVAFAIYNEEDMIYRAIDVMYIVEYIMPLEDPDGEARRQQKENLDTIVRNLNQLIDI